MADVVVRAERASDHSIIRELTNEAFKRVSYGDGNEGDIIDALRDAGDLALSLVAEEDGELVGQVTLSPATIGAPEPGWFGLGPIAVRIDRQRRGIGGRLMREALGQLKSMNAAGCVLVGDPGYYGRFGFFSDGLITYLSIEAPYVQRIVLKGPDRTGSVTFAPALHGA